MPNQPNEVYLTLKSPGRKDLDAPGPEDQPQERRSVPASREESLARLKEAEDAEPSTLSRLWNWSGQSILGDYPTRAGRAISDIIDPGDPSKNLAPSSSTSGPRAVMSAYAEALGKGVQDFTTPRNLALTAATMGAKPLAAVAPKVANAIRWGNVGLGGAQAAQGGRALSDWWNDPKGTWDEGAKALLDTTMGLWGVSGARPGAKPVPTVDRPVARQWYNTGHGPLEPEGYKYPRLRTDIPQSPESYNTPYGPPEPDPTSIARKPFGPEPPPETRITRAEGPEPPPAMDPRRVVFQAVRDYRRNPDSFTPQMKQALADRLVHDVGTPDALTQAAEIYQSLPETVQRPRVSGRFQGKTTMPERDPAMTARAAAQSAAQPGGEATGTPFLPPSRAGVGSVAGPVEAPPVSASPPAQSAPQAPPQLPPTARPIGQQTPTQGGIGASTPVWLRSPTALNSELGMQARRAGVKLSEAQYKQAATRVMQKGELPIDAVRAVGGLADVGPFENGPTSGPPTLEPPMASPEAISSAADKLRAAASKVKAKLADETGAIGDVEDARSRYQKFLEKAKKTGQASVAKGPDFISDGVWHVTFPDGRSYPIYRDTSSPIGTWEVDGLPNGQGVTGLSKQELIDKLSTLDDSKPYTDIRSGRSNGTIGERLARWRAENAPTSPESPTTQSSTQTRPPLAQRMKEDIGAVGDIAGIRSKIAQKLGVGGGGGLGDVQPPNENPSYISPEDPTGQSYPVNPIKPGSKSYLLEGLTQSMNEELKRMGSAGLQIFRKLARADQFERQYNSAWAEKFKNEVKNLPDNEFQNSDLVKTIKKQVEDEAAKYGVDASKIKDLPDFDTKENGLSYLEKMGRAIAQTKELGPENISGSGAAGIKDLIDSTPDPERTRALVERQLGRETGISSARQKVVNAIRTAETWTKLGNFAPANLLGGQTTTLLRSSSHPSEYFKALGRVIQNSPEHQALMGEAGIHSEVSHGILEDVNDKWSPTKLFGINATENLNRRIAAETGVGSARQYIEDLRANPNNKLARTRLEDLILEDATPDLIQKGLTPEQERMAAGRMAETTQGLNFQRNIPYDWAAKDMKTQLMTQFKKYAFQGSKSVWDSIKEDPKRNVPLFLAMTQIAGPAIAGAKSAAIGTWRSAMEGKNPADEIAHEWQNRPKYYTQKIKEIKKNFGDTDRLKTFGIPDETLGRILDNAFQSYAGGIPADILQAATSGHGGVLSTLAGPAAGDVDDIITDIATGNAKDLGKKALRSLPVPGGFGSAASKVIFPAKKDIVR